MAILTPGIGYLAGHGLDLAVKYYIEGESTRERNRMKINEISEIRKSIEIIDNEIKRAIRNKESPELIEKYESIRYQAHEKLADIISDSISSRQITPVRS